MWSQKEDTEASPLRALLLGNTAETWAWSISSWAGEPWLWEGASGLTSVEVPPMDGFAEHQCFQPVDGFTPAATLPHHTAIPADFSETTLDHSPLTKSASSQIRAEEAPHTVHKTGMYGGIGRVHWEISNSQPRATTHRHVLKTYFERSHPTGNHSCLSSKFRERVGFSTRSCGSKA